MSQLKYRISIGKVVNGEWKFDHYAGFTELKTLRVSKDGAVERAFFGHGDGASGNIYGIVWQDVSDTNRVEWGCVHDGLDLYENDIVTAPYYLFQDDGKYNYHGLIYYDKDDLLFGLGYVLVDKSKQGISDGIGNQLSEYDGLILLGNLNENPELLEAT